MPAVADTPELAYRSEVWRKLLHLFALTIPIGYYYVPWTIGAAICFGFFLIALIIDIARFRDWPIQRYWIRFAGPIVRPKEKDNFTGATNILASGWLCIVLFATPAAAMGMAAIILGDTAAALVGRRWGRHRITGNRTWEGSSAFFVAALAGGVLLPGITWPLALAAAVLATVVEAASRRIDDNLTVPLIVGVFVHIVLLYK